MPTKKTQPKNSSISGSLSLTNLSAPRKLELPKLVANEAGDTAHVWYRPITVATSREMRSEISKNPDQDEVDYMTKELAKRLCKEDGSPFVESHTELDVLPVDVVLYIFNRIVEDQRERGKAG